MKKNRKNIYLLILMVVLFTFFVYLQKDSLAEIITEIKHTPLAVVCLVILLAFLYQLMDALILWICAKNYNSMFTYIEAVITTFRMGFYRVITFGSGTAIFLMMHLNTKKIKMGEAGAISATMFMMHRISLVLLVSVFLLFQYDFLYLHYREYFTILMVIFVYVALFQGLMLAVCISSRLHDYLFNLGHKLFKQEKMIQVLNKFEKEVDLLKEQLPYILKRFSLVAKIVLVSVLKFVFIFSIPFVIANDLTLDYWHVNAVGSLVQLIVSQWPLPGGIGGVEVTFTLMFTPLIGSIMAMSSMVLFQFATYLLPFLCGGACELVHRIHTKEEHLQMLESD